MQNKKFEKVLLKKDSEIESISLSLVNQERTVTCLETGKSVLVETKEKLLFCSVQFTTIGSWISNNSRRHVSSLYLK